MGATAARVAPHHKKSTLTTNSFTATESREYGVGVVFQNEKLPSQIWSGKNLTTGGMRLRDWNPCRGDSVMRRRTHWHARFVRHFRTLPTRKDRRIGGRFRSTSRRIA